MCATGISIIVLTYRGRHQLKHCLLAAGRGLRNKDDEIIVTEDGEDTMTCEIIRSISERFQSPIKHLTLADPGRRLATARNRGFLAAKNDTILFLDHDVLLPPNFLTQLARFHQSGWVTAGRRFLLSEDLTRGLFLADSKRVNPFAWRTKIRAILSHWEGWRYLLPLRDITPGKKTQDWRGAAAFCFAVSRSDFLKVDGFDSRYDGAYACEDWDLFARLDHAGVNFGYLPRNCTVAHMHHPKSAHDLNSKNYKILEKVISKRAVKAVLGLETFL